MEFVKYWARGLVILAINAAVMLLVFPWLPIISIPTIILITLAVFALIGPRSAVGGAFGRYAIASLSYLAATFWSVFGVFFITSGDIFYATTNALQPTKSIARTIAIDEPDLKEDVGIVLLIEEPLRALVYNTMASRGNSRLKKIGIHSRRGTSFAEIPLTDVIALASQGASDTLIEHKLFVPYSSAILEIEIDAGFDPGSGYFSIGAGMDHSSYLDIASEETDSLAPWHWVVLRDAATADEIEFVARLSAALSDFSRSRHIRSLSLIRNAPLDGLADIEIARASYLQGRITSKVTDGAITRLQALSIADDTYSVLLTEETRGKPYTFLRNWLVMETYWALRNGAGEGDRRTRALWGIINAAPEHFSDLYTVPEYILTEVEPQIREKMLTHFGWRAKTHEYLYHLSKNDLVSLNSGVLEGQIATMATAAGDNECIGAFRLFDKIDDFSPDMFGEELFEEYFEEILTEPIIAALDATQVREDQQKIMRDVLDEKFYSSELKLVTVARSLGAHCSGAQYTQLQRGLTAQESGRLYTLGIADAYFFAETQEEYDEGSFATLLKYFDGLKSTLSEESVSEAAVKKLYEHMRALAVREYETKLLGESETEDDDYSAGINDFFSSNGAVASGGEYPWWRIEYQLFFAGETAKGMSVARSYSLGTRADASSQAAKSATTDYEDAFEELRKEMNIDFLLRDRAGRGVRFLPGVLIVALATENIDKALSLSLQSAATRQLQIDYESAVDRLLPGVKSPVDHDEEAAEVASGQPTAERIASSSFNGVDGAIRDWSGWSNGRATAADPGRPVLVAHGSFEGAPIVFSFGDLEKLRERHKVQNHIGGSQPN